MSSSRVEGGLFRLLIGAALLRAVWDLFWGWALPPKKGGAATLSDYTKILADHYLDAMRLMMNQHNLFWRNEKVLSMNEQVENQIKMDPLPHEKLKRHLRLWWDEYHPVIMTKRKEQEIERTWY